MAEIAIRILMHPAALPTIAFFINEICIKIRNRR